ncbi:unnamed protein product [Calypogeia fissa]
MLLFSPPPLCLLSLFHLFILLRDSKNNNVCVLSESKSKRTPLRKKYKILKKVKEHHKKKAKEAKKLGKSGKARVEKDPGIPNAWPFREQELQALEARRAKALEEQE